MEIQEKDKIINSSSSAFWATMILITLLITALNFAKPAKSSDTTHTTETTHDH